MTFTYDGADLAITIKNYKKNGNCYHVEYLDGTTSDYVCYDDNESQRLEGIMVNQALDRQGMMNIEKIEKTRNVDCACAVLTSLYTSFLYNQNKFTLCTLMLVNTGAWIHFARSNTTKVNELKKYKLFLEMYEDLSRVNEVELLSDIEPDHIYQIPLTISHVDDYSYRQMKSLYKKMNRMTSD